MAGSFSATIPITAMAAVPAPAQIAYVVPTESSRRISESSQNDSA